MSGIGHKPQRHREGVARDAADWFVAQRAGLDPQRREMFAAWLKQSPLHVHEYLETAAAARAVRASMVDPLPTLEELVARARASDEADPDSVEAPPRPAPPRLRWQFPAALAATLVVALSGWWWISDRNDGVATELEHFATAHGKQLTKVLADGTVMHLNTDTSIAVSYGPGERRVIVERGQTLFEVVHDGRRPFRVSTVSAEVVDIGTRFDVYVQDRATRVTVVEGRVAVSAAEMQGLGKHPSGGEPIVALAGQEVRVAYGENPSAPVQVNVDRVTSWLQGQIAFQAEPLSAVAAELNRYIAKPFEIETPALQQMPISGVFAIGETESFLAFLRSLDGVTVEVTPTRIRVYAR